MLLCFSFSFFVFFFRLRVELHVKCTFIRFVSNIFRGKRENKIKNQNTERERERERERVDITSYPCHLSSVLTGWGNHTQKNYENVFLPSIFANAQIRRLYCNSLRVWCPATSERSHRQSTTVSDEHRERWCHSRTNRNRRARKRAQGKRTHTDKSLTRAQREEEKKKKKKGVAARARAPCRERGLEGKRDDESHGKKRSLMALRVFKRGGIHIQKIDQ